MKRASNENLKHFLCFILFLLRLTECLPRMVRIGAIFTEDQKVILIFFKNYTWASSNIYIIYIIQDSPSELAFKYAVYKINKDPHILSNKTITYDVQYVPREDSFRTTNKVEKIFHWVFVLYLSVTNSILSSDFHGREVCLTTIKW